jgi:peptide/nickel transport system ATP-binding protein
VERRHRSFALDTSELPSLVKPRGFEPPAAVWREVGADHLVRED